jgi:hypothetical protein
MLKITSALKRDCGYHKQIVAFLAINILNKTSYILYVNS